MAVSWQQEKQFSTGPITYWGVVVQPPVEKEKSVKTELKLWASLLDTVVPSHAEKILLYLAKDSASLVLRQGDLLIFRGRLQPVNYMSEDFDYGAYMRRRRVYRSGYVPANNWCFLRHRQAPPIVQWFSDFRYTLLEALQQVLPNPDHYAIVAALTLGYKATMEEEVRQIYAAAGVMHILAVSGLHVGILYALFSFFTRPLQYHEVGRRVRFVLSLLFLWGMAFLTGFSPSVTRSVTMFSLVAMGLFLQRNVFAWRTIFVSAFMLILLKPLWLFEIGFQLSYSAVMAIVFGYPRLYRLCRFSSLPADYLWKMVVVSLVAQGGTLPFSLFYFHQFPLYFLLANLLVIPCATCILYAALAYLSLYMAGLNPLFLGNLLNALASFLHGVVNTIAQWPAAVISSIPFSVFDLMACVMALFLGCWGVAQKSLKGIRACLWVCGFWIIRYLYQKYIIN